MIRPDNTYTKPEGVDYYSLPFISNSRLNGEIRVAAETLEFGRQLHEAILEPEVYQRNLTVGDSLYWLFKYRISEMAKSARNNALLKLFLNDPKAEFEKEFFPVDVITGTQCKLKADIKLNKVIADLKTTDALTREDFEARALEYGYHQQAAFYLDGTGCEKFIIFAISKKYPYPTFTFTLTKSEIEKGRQQYEFKLAQHLSVEV